ncbi:TonB-dependent receptor [Sphingosinicella sp. LY1275]|uniref:TonB-dependent receptor n=1 Tax=Sphingosinicella sp. LY1275 TaxID=3095379 RepID=UPI002ADECC09|nr:TonB-dependent receptor [Sphingosinicella sp. LY1275]MEA1014102.1 TonB-dependent receptor [Sphingosinicella sp. LY1275]
MSSPKPVSWKRAALATGTSLTAFLAFSSAAVAQTGTATQDTTAATQQDDAIIVTAMKRASTILDVPFSINAQSEEDIQRSGATTVEDLSRNVAGLTVQNLGPGQSQVSVRGVSAGQIVRDQPGVKEQVGVYLDESVISLSLFTPDLDLFDLNRVETLRGPQGTLFGSGSVGGTIRYITNQPNVDRLEGQVEGNLNLVDGDDLGGHLKGAVNLPLIEGIMAVRAVAYHTRYGGFINARREGGEIDEDVNSGHRTGGRLALSIQPSDNVTITPRVVYQKIEVDGFNRQEVFNLYANPLTNAAAPGGRPPVTFDEREHFLLLDEKFKDETVIADLTASFGFGGVELTSVTSFIERDILVSRDASALTGSVSVDLGFPDAGVLLPSNLRDTTDLQTFTQELRLGSTGTGPLQWVIGGFYSDIKRVYEQRLPTPGYDAFTDAELGAGTSAAVANGFGPNSPYNADLPYDIKQKALFGEASYDLTDRLTATAGVRYYDFSEERDFISGGLFANGDRRIGDKTSSSGFTPRFLVTYEAWDNVNFNAQVSKGFRLGGVNDPLNLPLCTDQDEAIFGPFAGSFDDETLWNYEAGVKAQVGGLSFNAAGFYTDISNLQVTLDAGSCSSRIVFNVPEAHTMGVEFELAATPMEGLDLSLAGSWVEAEFDSTVTTGTGAVVGGIREGNRLPTVPKFQIAASAFYTVPLDDGGTNSVFGVTFQHVGSRYTQPSDQEPGAGTFVHNLAPFGGLPPGATTLIDLKLPSYELVNLSAGIEWDNGLSLTAYVNNLFDENPLLSFDRERGGRARLGFNVGQPRTYGITGRFRF